MPSPKKPRGARALAVFLPKMTKPIFRARGFAEAGVLNDWPDIVGLPLADYTEPLRLHGDGALEIRVGGGWALEIKHLEPLLLERIAGFFGYRAVTRLMITQGSLPPRPKRARKRSPKTLTRAEEEALRRDLAGTEDAGLRAALERLGREVLGTPADGETELER